MGRIATVLVIAAATGCATAVSQPQDPPAPGAQRPAVVRQVTAGELGASWRTGCPVGPDMLRRVELDYLGFDGRIHRGAMVVHRDVIGDVTAVFADLLRMGFPIERMQTVERYPNAEDESSMRDNNTSGFNCRALPGGGWSLHAYGRAVDLNPLVNPAIDAAGNLEPATARAYLDRTRDDLGLLRPGDAAVRAFTDRGWRWGGAWRDPVDYQHFEVG